MGKRKTHEQFMIDFYEKNSHANDIEILSRYINYKIKIKCRCKIDDYIWEARPDCLLDGQGCKECYNRNRTNTHEQFVKEVYEINPNVEIIGEYKGALKPIEVKCKVCGYKWISTPSIILSGNGCKECYNRNRTKTHEQFIKEMYNINPNIEILGTYEGNKIKIKYKCECANISYAIPSSLLNGCNCQKCCGKRIGNKLVKSHEQFIKQVHKANPNVKIIGTYTNGKKRIEVECLVCGNTWNPQADSILSGRSHCKECCNKKQTKTYEQFINEFYEKNSHANDIEIIGTYEGSNKRIKVKCKLCGYEWNPKARDLTNGHGCKECYIRNNRGENHPNYNPDLTDEDRENNESRFKDYEYRKLRIKSLEKYDNTCQCCNYKHDKNMNVHHLNGWNWDIEHRYDVNNSTVLCEDCHKEFHSIYGYGDNTKEQYIEFLNKKNKDNKKDGVA